MLIIATHPVRAATTTAELIVAMVVLSAAVGGVGRLASSVTSGLRERELSARIGWEIVNAREQIGSWTPGEITSQRIAALPISEALTSQLSHCRWESSVSVIERPARAIRVNLALVCEYQGQQASPQRLTFWVDKGPENAEVGDE